MTERGALPGSALVVIRLLLTALVAGAAWRFGLRGFLAALVIVVVLLVLLKPRKLVRNFENWR